MSRWSLALVIGLLFALGIGFVKYLEESKVAPTTTQNATILDALPTPNGIVIIVSAGDNIYRIYTNATKLNTSKPVILHFKDGYIEVVEQDGKIFKVMEFEKLKTLEKMPDIRR